MAPWTWVLNFQWIFKHFAKTIFFWCTVDNVSLYRIAIYYCHLKLREKVVIHLMITSFAVAVMQNVFKRYLQTKVFTFIWILSTQRKRHTHTTRTWKKEIFFGYYLLKSHLFMCIWFACLIELIKHFLIINMRHQQCKL